jgi:hypothetical protein
MASPTALTTRFVLAGMLERVPADAPRLSRRRPSSGPGPTSNRWKALTAALRRLSNAPRVPSMPACSRTMTGAPVDGRHDFDFLFGDWNVENRRLDHPNDPSCSHWQTFPTSVHVEPIFGGLGHHDLFTSPSDAPLGPWQGFTLRLYDPAEKQWRIWWTSTRAPGRLDPVMTGIFIGGTGTFFGNDTVDGILMDCRSAGRTSDPDVLVGHRRSSSPPARAGSPTGSWS